MRIKAFIALAAVAVVSCVPQFAMATTTTFSCSSQAVSTLIAGNETTDTANLIYVNGTCHASMCAGGQAYIDFSDKAIFAMALMAKAKGLSVDLSFEKDTTTPSPLVTKGTQANGSSPCRVRSLWY